MKFGNFIGIRHIKDLIEKKYNQDFLDIRQWWDDHNAGARAWDNATVTNLTSTGTTVLKGTTTNDSAATGNIGESVIASTTVGVSLGGSGVYTVILTLPLTAGDWDVSFNATIGIASVHTLTAAFALMSSTSTNDGTGGVLGDNQVQFYNIDGSLIDRDCRSMPSWRLSLSASATWYMKCVANYGAGAPFCFGRVSARRVR